MLVFVRGVRGVRGVREDSIAISACERVGSWTCVFSLHAASWVIVALLAVAWAAVMSMIDKQVVRHGHHVWLFGCLVVWLFGCLVRQTKCQITCSYTWQSRVLSASNQGFEQGFEQGFKQSFEPCFE